MPLELYYFFLSPPSRAVLSTMRHLGLDPVLKITSPLNGDTKKVEFLKMNPCHKIPVLNDDGFILHESRAIQMYVCNKYPNGGTLYPEDAIERAKVDKVLFFDATSYYPTLYQCVMIPQFRQKIQPSVEGIAQVSSLMSILEIFLGDKQFIAGDQASIADISLAVTVPILKAFIREDFLSAKMAGWYDRVLEAVPELKPLNEDAYSTYLTFVNNN